MTTTIVLNFKCKDCGTVIGQYITNSTNEDGTPKDKLPCPNCKSHNVEYQTRF